MDDLECDSGALVDKLYNFFATAGLRENFRAFYTQHAGTFAAIVVLCLLSLATILLGAYFGFRLSETIEKPNKGEVGAAAHNYSAFSFFD